MEKSGVYTLRVGRDRQYVGSSVNLDERIKGHKYCLTAGSHVNTALQADYNITGEFSAEILEYVSDDIMLLTKEAEWAGKLDHLYNYSEYSKSMPEFEQKDLDRFWSKIDKSGECWLWTESLDKDGYGKIDINSKTYLIHRLSYYLSGKMWIDNCIICHLCDHKNCVNPDHLMLGSHSINHRQRADKGDGCIINRYQANLIREECLLHQGQTYKQLANILNQKYKFNLRRHTVRDVIQNISFADDTWNPNLYIVNIPKGDDLPHTKLNWGIVNDIRNKRKTDTNLTSTDLQKYILYTYNVKMKSHYLVDVLNNFRWHDENYVPTKYKPKPRLSTEIIDFIIQYYDQNKISLRGLARLVNDKFNVKTNHIYIKKLIKNIQ